MDTPTTVVPAAHVTASDDTMPDSLLEPFRVELLRLLEKPFTVSDAAKALPKIGRTVKAAIQALGLRDSRSKLRKLRGYPGYACTPWDMEMEDDDEQPVVGTVGMNPVSMNPSPIPNHILDRETFGATAIREIVATLKPSAQPVTEIVKAIAEARTLGLEDVAADLLQQLRGAAAAPADPATKTAVGLATIAVAVTREAECGTGFPVPPPLPEGVLADAQEV